MPKIASKKKESKPSVLPEKKWTVALDKLIPLEKNARRHSERNVIDIINSLTLHGQVTPIVVDSKNVIRKGNGTFLAAQQLGWKTLWVVPYLKAHNAPEGAEDEEKLRAYQLQDNRSAETSEWDYEQLRQDYEYLKKAGFDVALLGWQNFEIDPILQANFQVPTVTHDLDSDEFKHGPQEFGAPIQVTKDQRDIFDRAKAKAQGVTEMELSDGRALELICGDYLA